MTNFYDEKDESQLKAEELKDRESIYDEIDNDLSQEEQEQEDESEKAPPGEEVDMLRAEIEEWKQSYLRKQADFQNFTKRKEKELNELRKYSSEQIILKLLFGLDNLERALEVSEKSKDFDGLIKGVEMIVGQFKDIMKEEGVEELKSLGELFDPIYHNAVAQELCDDCDDNTVIMELQKGYKLKDKVIRPAMVKVSKRS